MLLQRRHSPAIGNSLNASFEKIPPSPAAPFYIGPFSPSLGSSHYNLISPYKHAQTGSVDFQWDLAAPVLSSDALMDNTDKLQLQLSSMELCEENALRCRAVSGSITPRININSIWPGPTAAGFVFATPAPLTYTRSISDSNVPTSTISIGSTTASLDSRSSVHSRVLSSGGWQATSGDKHRNPSLLMCTPASVVNTAPGLRISNVDRELRVLGDLGLAPALSSSCLIFGSPPPMATSTAATVLSSMVV